jgi:hypothetical protein
VSKIKSRVEYHTVMAERMGRPAAFSPSNGMRWVGRYSGFHFDKLFRTEYGPDLLFAFWSGTPASGPQRGREFVFLFDFRSARSSTTLDACREYVIDFCGLSGNWNGYAQWTWLWRQASSIRSKGKQQSRAVFCRKPSIEMKSAVAYWVYHSRAPE